MTQPIFASADAFLATGAESIWPANVQAAFTTRQGGVSPAPFDSWNLGDHVADDPERVAHNRRLLAERLGVRPVFMQQVHGFDVVEITPDTPDGIQADACWTCEPGVACTVMVADCLPILLSAADGSSVAAVHAGWRGLAGVNGRGVLEALFECWPHAQSAFDRAQLKVWLGPCIGPQAFEVGPEVRAAFVQAEPAAVAGFKPGLQDKWYADLAWLARQRFQALGVPCVSGNDGQPAWCTVSQPSRFFSHRRDAVRLGSTGRMAAVIWRTGF